MNKSGAIGTAGETAVVKVLKEFWPKAERRRLKGAQDWGDIINAGDDLIWEVKAGKAAGNASDAQIELWLDETEEERKNAGARLGILVVKRKGISNANAHRWWAILRLIYVHPDSPATHTTVRFYLGEYAAMLRKIGY